MCLTNALYLVVCVFNIQHSFRIRHQLTFLGCMSTCAGSMSTPNSNEKNRLFSTLLFINPKHITMKSYEEN